MTVPAIARTLATALVGAVLVLGCGLMWIGVPLVMLWLGGEITTTPQMFLFVVLGGTPLAMVALGLLLVHLNGYYEFLRDDAPQRPSRSAWLVSSSAERKASRQSREPRRLLDTAMTVSALTALLLFLIWFFALAEMKLVSPV